MQIDAPAAYMIEPVIFSNAAPHATANMAASLVTGTLKAAWVRSTRATCGACAVLLQGLRR
jgi:hypothetical protein